jgi:Epoxide hydrolase N terminus
VSASPAGTAIFFPARPAQGLQQKEGSIIMTDPTIRPFEVHVPVEDVADLQRRVAATRWPGRELVADQSQGVQLATIQNLVTYWGTG